MSTNKKYNRNQQKSQTQGKLKPLHDLERIAAEMDVICRKRLPDGMIRYGVLMGREPEIRQQALIQALGGFLQKNLRYVEAVKSNDDDAVKAAIEQCAAIKLRYAKLQIANDVALVEYRYIPLDEINGGVCQHPSDLDSSDWPADAKAGVVRASVRRAVREGLLSLRNASIVGMLCDQGLSVAQTARVLEITPEAIYPQLRRVKNVLPKMMEFIEVKWDFTQQSADERHLA